MVKALFSDSELIGVLTNSGQIPWLPEGPVQPSKPIDHGRDLCPVSRLGDLQYPSAQGIESLRRTGLGKGHVTATARH